MAEMTSQRRRQLGWGRPEVHAQGTPALSQRSTDRAFSVAGPEAQARELMELQHIYMDRGLNRELARQVSRTLYLQKPCDAAV